MVTTEALSISPYVGPRPFEAADRGAFFGRAGEVSRLVSEVIANPTVLVYAVSGAGKTSLLAAGLAPALIEQGFEALPLARVGGGAPPPDAANAFVYCALQSIAHAGPADRADSPPRIDETLAERLAALPKGSDELGFPRPRVIVFDQFEELFTFHEDRWQERHGFFAQVAAALDQEPELRVVFSLREEYLAQLERYADQVPGAFRARFHLGRLRRKAAVQAVICPLQASNKHFAPGVAERLVDDLGQSRVSARAGQPVTVQGEFVEPLHLQVVCDQLWRRIPPDQTEITADDLAAFGDVDEALTYYYEQAIASAARASSRSERKLRQALERLFITRSGTRAIVFAGAAEEALRAKAAAELERQHLIRRESRSGADWFELSHDRLIEPIQQSNRRVRTRHLRGAVTVLSLAVVLALGAAVAVLVGGASTATRNDALAARVGVLQKKVPASESALYRIGKQWLEDINAGNYARASSLMAPGVQIHLVGMPKVKTLKTAAQILSELRKLPCRYTTTHGGTFIKGSGTMALLVQPYQLGRHGTPVKCGSGSAVAIVIVVGGRRKIVQAATSAPLPAQTVTAISTRTVTLAQTVTVAGSSGGVVGSVSTSVTPAQTTTSPTSGSTTVSSTPTTVATVPITVETTATATTP